MKVINQDVVLVTITDKAAPLIETAARICYKSEDRITPTSAEKLLTKLLKAGHESVIEHASATFRITTNRAIANEIVRHRIASYSQTSTRYVSHDNLEIIMPELNSTDANVFKDTIEAIEGIYRYLHQSNKAEVARDILPLCTVTELVMTANFREWRHFIKLRTSPRAHYQIRWIAKQIYNILHGYYPYIFPKELCNEMD